MTACPTRFLLAAGLFAAMACGTRAQSQDAVAIAMRDGQHPIGSPWGFQPARDADPSLPRVLLIGDSILGGYRDEVIRSLAGVANVDCWQTPQFLTDELCRNVGTTAAGASYQVIHFNESGLHAWQEGRVPPGRYGPLLRQYIEAIRAAAPGAHLIWASTTPVTVPGQPGMLDPVNATIVQHNAEAGKIAREEGVATDDLYLLMMVHLDSAKGDRWHWNAEGFSLLAKSVTESIRRALPR